MNPPLAPPSRRRAEAALFRLRLRLRRDRVVAKRRRRRAAKAERGTRRVCAQRGSPPLEGPRTLRRGDNHLLPLPVRHERGEGWGEGFPSWANNPPLPDPLLHPMEEREFLRLSRRHTVKGSARERLDDSAVSNSTMSASTTRTAKRRSPMS